MLQWDYDKIVPVFGFGAKINGRTEQCFPMFQGQGVFEVAGVMVTYSNWLNSNCMIFSGPTNFAPTIHKVNELAKECALFE